MGGIAGAAGARRRRLTRWAFALDDLPYGVADRVALILAPDLVARLPPLWGDALVDAAVGGPRRVRRRQVLAALAARLDLTIADVGLTIDPGGVRRITGTSLYASMAERSGWAGAVLSRAPVGIDLEGVGEAEAGAAAVLGGVDGATPANWHGLAGLWAAREATLKALGHDLTRDPGRWRFGRGVVTPAGGPPHRVDCAALPDIVAAVAYVGD